MLAQALERLVEERALAGPVGRRAAAVEHEPGGRRVAFAQVGVGLLQVPRVGRRELAARKEDRVARGGARGVARQRGLLADGEAQVLQGEVEGRGRHATLAHHLAARVADHLGHVEVDRTDLVAQAAATARVDHAVGRAAAPALRHREVVVDAARVEAGVRAELLQVRARLDALETLALQAARRFGSGLVARVAGGGVGRVHGRRTLDAVHVDDQAGGVAAAIAARGAERDVLQLAVDGERRPATVGDRRDRRPRLGGPQDAAAAVGAELAGRQRDRVDGDAALVVEQVTQGGAGVGLGGAHGQVHGVDVGRQGGERVLSAGPRERYGGERHELGARRGDARDVGLELGLGEHVVAELASAAAGSVLRLEDDDRVALAGELVGGAEAAQAGAHDGHAAGLRAARDRRRRRRLVGQAHGRALEVVDADAAARLLAHAGRLAGGVAAARDHAREGHRLGEGAARLGPVVADRRREQGPRVDVHRTRRHTGGRLVLDAVLLELQQPLLVHRASFGKADRPGRESPGPAARRAGRLTAAGASLTTLSRPGCRRPSWRPGPSRAAPAGAARGRRRRRGWR